MNKIEKPVAIGLGGTIPHKNLIKLLKKRGYFTILVDYLKDPPAKLTADIHLQKSTLDQLEVLKIAKEYQAELVVCGCVDQANITACYVMEQIGKRPPYSYKTALQITNKGEMKRIMTEKGIPTARYLYVDKEREIDFEQFDLRYPVMVKPADSNSANGVRKAYCREETEIYLHDALEISRNGRAIVEEFLVGQEISAYCYIQDKKAKLLMTAERISMLDGENEIIKCFASIAPARISEVVEQRAENIATQIAKAFNLDNTPLFFQGIVREEQIAVIEFAPRIGGGACFRTIEENTGVDVISAIIDSWEGKRANISKWKKADKLLVVNTVYGKNGIFDHLEGVDKILDSGEAIDYYQIRSKGDKIDNSRASSSRIAFFIVSALNEDDLLKKVHGIYEKLRILDSKGENLIRYDMNLETLWDCVKQI